MLKTSVESLKEESGGIRVTFKGEVKRKKKSTTGFSFGRTAPNSQIPGLEKTKVVVDPKASSRSTSNCRPPIQRSTPLATWSESRCWPTKLRTRAARQWNIWAGRKYPFEPYVIPAVVFTDPEIAWAGLTETQAKNEGREIKVAKFPWGASGRAVTLDRTEGVTKLLIDPKTERILGIGIVRPRRER